MIIFLHGADTFRSRRKLTQIKEKFVREVDRSGVNVETVNATSATPEQLERALTTQPFLAPKRLIIIENLFANAKAHKLHAIVLEAIKRGHESTIIVIWDGEVEAPKAKRGKKADQSSKTLFTTLTKERFTQKFDLVDAAGARSFIATEAKARNITIEDAAIRELADMVGNDLWQADREIEKLKAYAGNRAVTASDIAMLVVTKLEDDIFALTDALSNGNKPRALKLLSDQLSSGASPTEVLATIAWQYRALMAVKSFVEAHGPGYPADRIARELALHPFVVKKALVATKRYELSALRQCCNALITADFKIKTGQATPEVLLDLFVITS